MSKSETTPDLALLRSALSRILSAKDWATKCGLINVGCELGMAGSEIRKFILKCPTRNPVLEAMPDICGQDNTP